MLHFIVELSLVLSKDWDRRSSYSQRQTAVIQGWTQVLTTTDLSRYPI